MSEKQFPSDSLPEIRVKGVSVKTHNELQNIAENNGVSLSNFLRPKLTEIANGYPDHMKLPPRKD
jgi:hypothetical protein